MIVHTATHDDWVTGNDRVCSTSTILAANQGVIPSRTPIGQVTATGEFKVVDLAANDGSQVATRITAYEVDTTVAAQECQAYKVGTFNPELVSWPASFDTAAKKAVAFTGTPISLQTPRQY